MSIKLQIRLLRQRNDFIGSTSKAEKFDYRDLACGGCGRIAKVRQSHWTVARAFVIRASCFGG